MYVCVCGGGGGGGGEYEGGSSVCVCVCACVGGEGLREGVVRMYVCARALVEYKHM